MQVCCHFSQQLEPAYRSSPTQVEYAALAAASPRSRSGVTSALLAMLTAVRKFGRALTQPVGAPAGAVEAVIEVPFLLGEERLYPDGVLRVRRGAEVWTALVEVMTGSNVLAARQLEKYLDVAREQGFDARW